MLVISVLFYAFGSIWYFVLHNNFLRLGQFPTSIINVIPPAMFAGTKILHDWPCPCSNIFHLIALNNRNILGAS
jgi:hypothetical protein